MIQCSKPWFPDIESGLSLPKPYLDLLCPELTLLSHLGKVTFPFWVLLIYKVKALGWIEK
jgi:hypothetical protein